MTILGDIQRQSTTHTILRHWKIFNLAILNDIWCHRQRFTLFHDIQRYLRTSPNLRSIWNSSAFGVISQYHDASEIWRFYNSHSHKTFGLFSLSRYPDYSATVRISNHKKCHKGKGSTAD